LIEFKQNISRGLRELKVHAGAAFWFEFELKSYRGLRVYDSLLIKCVCFSGVGVKPVTK
jgi:hypothetical protein